MFLSTQPLLSTIIVVDAYTTIAGVVEYVCYRSQRTLLKTTLLTIKLATSLGLRKKSNKQSNLSLNYNSTKLISRSIKPTTQPNRTPKPITQAIGKFTNSTTQLGEESTRPI